MNQELHTDQLHKEPNPELLHQGFMELGIADSAIERVAQLRVITGEGIFDLTQKIHKVVAPELSHEPFDKVMHIQAPDGSNKRELMQPAERMDHYNHAAELIRQLTDIEAGEEDQANVLKRAGNVLALAVVQTHTFEDANGRTARSLAQLVREGVGEQGGEPLDNLLLASKNRPDSGFRINSFVPINEGAALTPNEVLDRAAALDIPLEDSARYLDQRYRTFSSPYPD